EIAFSWAPPVAPSASGISVQLVPSQCSSSAWVAPLVVDVPAVRAEPTAQTSWEERAATALSVLSVAVRFRLGTTAQETPSPCPVRVPPADWPTAQRSVGATAATPCSSLLRVPGLELLSGAHWPALHCSTRVGPAPLTSSCWPTAHTVPAAGP